MELIELKNKIIESVSCSHEELETIIQLSKNGKFVYPFNEYEFLIFNLIQKGFLSFENYCKIRNEYILKNSNLWIYEISSPRYFGENFAHIYVQELCPKLKNPNKKLDPNYSGEYDLWLDGIKIEVKASRVDDSDSNEPLYKKALSRNTKKNFLMNFQQLKPQFCDIFIWIAVFRDQIVLWIMNSKEVISHPAYSKGQHRGNKGNEGQLHITNDNINQFEKYELKEQDLEQAIKEAMNRN